MVKNIIYKDTYYTFSTDDVRFRLVADGNVVYEGRSKAKPNSSYAQICVNKICQNYLSNSYDGIGLSSTTHSDAYREFSLQTLSGETWGEKESYGFLWDWDEDTTINFSSSNTLSKPIINRNVAGQLMPTTIFNNGSVSTTIVSANTGNSCGQYALFYRNLAGGWDSMLMEGKCKESDEYMYSQMKKSYNNNNLEFGKNTYVNQRTKKWVLNTGYLSDSESKKFAKYVASSTEVYLQDIENNKIIPVVITDTNVNYKQYLQDDDNPVFYTINVESSQTISIF